MVSITDTLLVYKDIKQNENIRAMYDKFGSSILIELMCSGHIIVNSKDNTYTILKELNSKEIFKDWILQNAKRPTS